MRYIQLIIQIIILLTLVGVTGCEKAVKKHIPPLKPVQSDMAVINNWRYQVGGSNHKHSYNLTPVINGNSLYIPDIKGHITHLNFQNGKIEWKKRIADSISSPLARAGDILVAGTGNASVVAVNSLNGQPLWRHSVTNEVLATPLVFQNTVIVKTIDEMVYALDLQTGKEKWHYEHDKPEIVLRLSSAPVQYADMVLIGFADGKLVALSKQTGQVLWMKSIAQSSGFSPIEQMFDINSSPIVSDQVLYVASFHGKLSAINLNTGELLWNYDLSTYQDLLSDHDSLYVIDTDSRLWKFNKRNGQVLWKQDDFKHRELKYPMLFKQTIMLADDQGYVHFLSPSDGHVVGRLKLDSNGVSTKPQIIGKQVIIYTNNGVITKYTIN